MVWDAVESPFSVKLSVGKVPVAQMIVQFPIGAKQLQSLAPDCPSRGVRLALVNFVVLGDGRK